MACARGRKGGPLAGLVFVVFVVTLGLRFITAQSIATAFVFGVVADASSGSGVAEATVILEPLPTPGSPMDLGRQAARQVVLSTNDGHFLFRGLEAGIYVVSATRDGYLGPADGQEAGGGASSQVSVRDGQGVGDLKISLSRAAAISGTVLDENGAPVVGEDVLVIHRRFVAGRSAFVSTDAGRTDDRGMFRCGQLPPGDYMVAAVSTLITRPAASSAAIVGQQIGNHSLAGSLLPVRDGARILAYPTTFYPAATEVAQAKVIPLRSGDERTGVDMVLAPVPTVSVSGFLNGHTGSDVDQALHLAPAGVESLGIAKLDTAIAFTDERGAFEFLGVPPGEYVVSARLPGTSGSSDGMPVDAPLWLSVPLTVGAESLDNIALSGQPSVRIKGHLLFVGEGSRPAADQLKRVFVSLTRADGRAQTGPPLRGPSDEAGRFELFGPPFQQVIVAVSSPPGWVMKSAVVGGKDVTDLAFGIGPNDVDDLTLTFTDQTTELTGTVHAPLNASGAGINVVIFPADKRRWVDCGASPRRFRGAFASHEGTYRFTLLPAGDYLVAAIPASLGSSWRDPSVLETISRSAAAVTFTDGARRSQDLDLLVLK